MIMDIKVIISYEYKISVRKTVLCIYTVALFASGEWGNHENVWLQITELAR
jgi:hypothetical protein